MSASGVLSRDQILELLQADPPLVAGVRDPEAQLQPNGIDLTLHAVARFVDGGALGAAAGDRRLPETEDLAFDADGWLALEPGPYLVRYHETVNLPVNVMAYSPPRSSLLRSGVAVHGAVWDAGYSGQGAGLLVTHDERMLDLCDRVIHIADGRLSEAGAAAPARPGLVGNRG